MADYNERVITVAIEATGAPRSTSVLPRVFFILSPHSSFTSLLQRVNRSSFRCQLKIQRYREYITSLLSRALRSNSDSWNEEIPRRDKTQIIA